MQTPWAGSHQRRTQAHALCQMCRFRDRPTGTMISELNTIQGSTASRYLSSSHPFCVRFNESLRKRRQDHGFTILIDALQHSIPGLSLTATRAGIPPACHQNISSPHVHSIVIACSTKLVTGPPPTSAASGASPARPVNESSLLKPASFRMRQDGR